MEIRRSQIRTLWWMWKNSPAKFKEGLFLFLVSIRGTNRIQFLRYSNLLTMVSNASKPIFSCMPSSLIVIRRFERMSSSRHTSFSSMATVHGRPECGLSFISLSPLLLRAAHSLTMLTSTVWSSSKYSKQISMDFNSCNVMEFNHNLYFVRTSMSDAILIKCPSIYCTTNILTGH